MLKPKNTIEAPEHREQQHVAPADAVGDRGEEERADHVTRQVEDDRHAQRGHRVGGGTAMLQRNTALDERHVDVEHVIEREQEAGTDDPDKHTAATRR